MVASQLYKFVLQSVKTKDVCDFHKKMNKEVLLISYQKFYSRRKMVEVCYKTFVFTMCM